MPSKLHSAVSNFKAAANILEIPGLLGVLKGGKKLVDVPDRTGFVYVRLRENTSELIQAFNNKVSPVFNLPVRVTRQGNRYVVTGTDTQRVGGSGDGSAYLPAHGFQHTFDGGDTTWIDSQQFTPLLATPSGSSVSIYPYLDRKSDGLWAWIGGTGTVDLMPYKPTGSSAEMVLVYVDAATGNPGVLNGGTPFDASYTYLSQIAQYIPSLTGTSRYPVAAVRLLSGTSSIEWENVYDARQFFKEGGGGGGGSTTVNADGVIIWNEGTPLGTGSVLNFVGDNIDVTLSGTVARVFVMGSSGTLNDYINVRDEKPSGTYAGSSVADAWTIRDINTEVSDAGGFCSIATNQITLEAGTYIAQITAPFFSAGRVAIRLRNTTDNETTLLGSGGYNDTHCHLVGKFTIAAQKVFEVQYICETATADVGLGLPVAEFLANYSEAIEIYTVAEFWRVG